MNPFRFGGPVKGEYYLERPELRRVVATYLDNHVNVVLVGPRRFGKTSFILDLLRYQEEHAGMTCVMIDIYNVTSHRDFLRQVLHALHGRSTLWQRFLVSARQIGSRLKLSAGVGQDNTHMKVALEYGGEDDVKNLILEALDSLAAMAPHPCIVIDEFQSVARLDDQGWLEATLRTKMQEHRHASFIFSGSRRSMIHEMFNDSGRPFYRSCQLIDFPFLGREFTDWVIERFRGIGIEAEREVIEYLREQVSETPNYVQMACFHIVAEGHRRVDRALIDRVLGTIVKQADYAYQTVMNALPPGQQRVLRMAALEDGEAMFAKDKLERYEIRHPSHVAQSIRSLKDKHILDESPKKGKVIFDDPLFALWLRHEFSG